MTIPLLRRSALLLTLASAALAAETAQPIWSQWRGPERNGSVAGNAWPAKLSGGALEPTWRVPLGPSYSGPIIAEDAVFVTETQEKKTEIVRALDRKTGQERWTHSWAGAISVPFFAKSRGDWIRATPALDGETLYVVGIRDVLVAIDARSGRERWQIDFAKKYGTGAPSFGQVCSPLPDGDSIYLQAANSVVRIRKTDGAVVWRAYEGKSGMMAEGAFSSPVIGVIGGVRQIVAQTREKLAGLDLATGRVLWEHPVPSYRGMNILPPTLVGDAVFTSSYQNRSWLYRVAQAGNGFEATEGWSNNAQAYMSSPIVVGSHAYVHLANQRFTCIDLKTGARTWTSDSFGKYVSMVVQGDRILGLDERGILLLIQADPKAFRLIDQQKVSDTDAWAHLGISGDEVFVRELNALAVFRWRGAPAQAAGQ